MEPYVGSYDVHIILEQSAALTQKLRSRHVIDLAPTISDSLRKAIGSLETRGRTRAQDLLLLSSAQLHAKRVERLAEDRIKGGKGIPSQEISALMDIRVGCHRAVRELSHDMNRLRGR